MDFNTLIRTEKIPPARTVPVYLHIPFCKSMCSFCPFQKGLYKQTDQVEAYVAALLVEMRAKADFVGASGGQIRTIYIGGGTPSILTPENIRQIGTLLHSKFDLLSLAEFTLECEPKSATKEKLHAAREIGVKQISFGVQTFNERFQSLFNLTATQDDIENTLKWSQEIIGRAGFDMLYGMHGQSAEQLLYDLKRATELRPETINLSPINNLALTPKLHKSYAAQDMKPSSLSHRQVLRLFGETFMRGCGYAPCNGHSYIRGADPNRSEYITHVQEKGGPKVHDNRVSAVHRASKPLCMRLPYNGYIARNRIAWAAADPFVCANLQRIIAGTLLDRNNKRALAARAIIISVLSHSPASSIYQSARLFPVLILKFPAQAQARAENAGAQGQAPYITAIRQWKTCPPRRKQNREKIQASKSVPPMAGSHVTNTKPTPITMASSQKPFRIT